MNINNKEIIHTPLKPSQALPFPQMIVINSIFPCNAHCPHCPYTVSNLRKEQRAKDNPMISEKIFKLIADQIGEHGATLRISGAGEPLLHPQMIDLIVYAKSVGCQIGLITNGSLMSEDKIQRLLEANVEMIEFSVDAGDSETYQIVRKGLHFETTLKNIKKSIELRNQINPSTNIIVSIVNQKIIEAQLPEAIKFWENIVDKVQVRKFLTWDIHDLNQSADTVAYLESEDTPCPMPFDRLLIDTNGDVRFCIYDIKARTTWGNINNESISDIWTGEKFSWLRQIHNSGEFHKMEICSNCLDRQFRSWNYNYYHLRKTASQSKANSSTHNKL